MLWILFSMRSEKALLLPETAERNRRAFVHRGLLAGGVPTFAEEWDSTIACLLPLIFGYFSLRARSIRKNISVLSIVPLKRLAPGPRAPTGTSTAECPPTPPSGDAGVSVVVGFRSRRFRGRS